MLLLLLLSSFMAHSAQYLVNLGDHQSLKLEASQAEVQYQGQSLPVQKFEVKSFNQPDGRMWEVKDLISGQAHKFQAKEDLIIKGSDLRAGTMKLPQEIKLHDDKGFFHLIGVVQERDYLVGVLSNEIPLSWPMESLKAQAVAARSYAKARSNESNTDPHHLVATMMDQVFSFPDYGNDKNLVRALTAVESTKDVVLKDPVTARTIKAFYHSDCGGMTLPSSTVFGSGKDYGSTLDKSCSQNPNSRWNFRLDEKNQKILAQKLGIKQSKNLIFYQVNAGLLRVGNSVGELKDVWIQKFREILGFDKVRSLKFTIAKDENGLVLEGNGFGHGVGMCQWGARKLGEEGANYQKILSHYYPKAKISKANVVKTSADPDTSRMPLRNSAQ